MRPTTGMTEFVCVRPDGERVAVTVAIGHPYPTSGGDWACPVEITRLHGRILDIHGIDSLQALCLATRLAGTLLRDFVADGGRILDPGTGNDVPLDGYFELAPAAGKRVKARRRRS